MITLRTVQSLDPDATIWDDNPRGFGVRRQRGNPFYVLKYRIAGRQRYPYHLKIKRREGLRGRPETTAGVWRDAVVWLMFKTACDKGLKAEEALEAIHDELGMSVGSVKAAVRRLNKTATAPPINS